MSVLPPTQHQEPERREADVTATASAAKTPGPARARGSVRLGSFTPRSQRNPRALVIAVAAHLVIGVALLRAITFDTGFRDYFGFEKERPSAERLTLVETVPVVEPEPVVPRDPAIPAPVSAPSRGPVLAGPDVAAAPGALVAPPIDSGTLVSRLPPGESAVVGLVPRADPRLWTMADLESLRKEVREAAQGAGGALTGARELDSVITWTLMAARDSLDSLNVLRAMGATTASWTKKDANGGTWGVDAAGLRLGKVTIPSALLGLLPMGAQQVMSGNRTTMERNRQLSYAQSDIARFRESGPGNDQFKMLVKELRERRDRERAARRAQAPKPVVGGSGTQNGTPP